MLAFGLGKVVASKSSRYDVGSLVWGTTMWREYSIMQAEAAAPVQ
jgi:NADPH-dependent curcumin reductase CurA